MRNGDENAEVTLTLSISYGNTRGEDNPSGLVVFNTENMMRATIQIGICDAN